MRRVLEPDHDLLGEDEPPRDLVLGMPALLGIFLAVVLVCAVCFGFGYSSGHGFHLGSSADVGPHNEAQMPPSQPAAAPPSGDSESGSAAEAPDAASSAGTAAQQSASASKAGKPNPGMTYTPEAPQAQQEAQTQPATPGVSAVPLPREALGSARDSQAMMANAAPKRAEAPVTAPAAAMPAPERASSVQPQSLMVQIAAVTQAADAETLSVALRHDGFAAVVRTTTGDPYFHVQVGPFASYAAAQATRSRLAASGYTAFIRH